MSLKLGDEFPNFHLKTSAGDFQFHEWLGNQWGILFSHPADYTPVCTTELSRAAKLAPEFAKRNTKLIGLSCDTVENHHGWIKDLQSYAGSVCSDGACKTVSSGEFAFPIIDDSDRKLAKQLGMIDPDEFDTKGLPLTARAVFFIGLDKKVKASLLYPATTGRNFDEILRLLDSLQLSARLPIATPVDWKVGDKVMVPPSVKDEDVQKYFPQGVQIKNDLPSGKSYIRMAQV
ncbi:unnamed protein product [Rotaria socialis]|uniref:Thioredoxin domain-containing protein n=1 Tax=Rotaria socialis TaxID=392032 RepID=A0A817T621_9BILA|nr:unnamed protein product [Rotaria socialis]CAF3309527.1 unnamed protein product [Rotaria socialis]CAF3339135.1 unnamed protein product [Rotaria socialis]CAF3371104.1 unnamed protein product [Rotaria socialis]CAF3498976.1 unnamed protein product [Rotaria socialis]